MSHYLTTLDYTLWFAAIALHVVMSAVIVHRGLYRHFPYFAGYVVIALMGYATCLWTAFNSDVPAYVYVKLVTSSAESIMLGLFLSCEVYPKTFGPKDSLPDGVPVRTLTSIIGCYAGALSGAALLPAYGLTPAIQALCMADRLFTGALACVSLVLLFYAWHLDIRFRPHTLIITCGILFNNTVDLGASYVRPHLAHSDAALMLRYVSSAAYVITLVLWIWGSSYFREPVPITAEQLTADELRLANLERSAQALLQ